MITVSIALDNSPNHFTNLDVISGRVLLRVSNSTAVSSISCKLEGESKTRLLAPIRPDLRGPENRPNNVPLLEVHKLLYKVLTVFPPTRLQGQNGQSTTTYTLSPGQYEYPFMFKIPINNHCVVTNSASATILAGLQREISKAPTKHVKQTLPPSLTGFPGEAEIRYFLKVTVNRPSLLKENPRAYCHFNFLPIEPPRRIPDGESYARRQHQYRPVLSADGEKKGSFFSKAKENLAFRDKGPEETSNKEPPRFSVDARLPNPAVLTCNENLPLRILVKQLSDRDEILFLQILQVELIGYTRIRAHDAVRVEGNSWVLISLSNMNIPIGNPADTIGVETPINPEYWIGRPLPNTVAPSFETCNISRYYELEVRVGLGYGSSKQGRDQLTILPLRLPVEIYSGIAPPPALLKAAVAKSDEGQTHGTAVPSTAADKPSFPVEATSQAAPSPSYTASSSASSAAPQYNDAPPSYEDAVGQDLPPFNGPRRDYAPPPAPEGAPRFSGDEKR